MDISGNENAMQIDEIVDTETYTSGYEVEDLLEMLGGDQYYSMDKIMYVYHTLRNEYDEAAYYKDIMDRKDVALNKKLSKMKNNNIG